MCGTTTFTVAVRMCQDLTNTHIQIERERKRARNYTVYMDWKKSCDIQTFFIFLKKSHVSHICLCFFFIIYCIRIDGIIPDCNNFVFSSFSELRMCIFLGFFKTNSFNMMSSSATDCTHFTHFMRIYEMNQLDIEKFFSLYEKIAREFNKMQHKFQKPNLVNFVFVFTTCNMIQFLHQKVIHQSSICVCAFFFHLNISHQLTDLHSHLLFHSVFLLLLLSCFRAGIINLFDYLLCWIKVFWKLVQSFFHLFHSNCLNLYA